MKSEKGITLVILAIITKVKIEDKIEPTSTEHYFDSLSKITEIENMVNLDTDNVTNMRKMFNACSRLTSLDLSNFDTSNVTYMSRMFYDCRSLTTIYVKDLWSTASVTSGTEMFHRCSKLKGAISYDSSKTDATYANYTTGYLTYKGANNLLSASDIASNPGYYYATIVK